MINSFVEKKAEKLLEEAGCLKLPINIDKCASHLNIVINPMDLEDEVSGFLILDNGNNHIGYNKAHSVVRTRFTIAHELGHFMLHSKSDTSVFIEKNESSKQKILYRNQASSTGESLKEREANSFAAALLMPKKLIEVEVDSIKSSLNDIDKIIKKLASKFQVSEIAMNIRLANLHLLDYDF